jgi:chromosome segregation ATPase
MFRFESIELYQWDYWKRPFIPLDEQIITVVGPNGSGKTTFLDSLRTLLNVKQSHKRNLRKYLRHDFAAIKAVVKNVSKTKNGQKSFAPRCLSDKVTLCVTFSKGSETANKKFYIENGDVPFEEFLDSKIVRGKKALTSTDYSAILKNAGLSKSVLKVLALEQGATDELCEKSPRELLSLVFDIFGDSIAISNYQKALQGQLEAEEELRQLETEYDRESTSLEREQQAIEAFEEHKERLEKVNILRNEKLPQATTIDLLKKLYQAKKNKEKYEEELESRYKERVEIEHQSLEAEKNHKNLENERKKLSAENQILRENVDNLSQEIFSLESLLTKEIELEKSYKNLSECDLSVLSENLEKAENRYKELSYEEVELEKKMNNLRAEISYLQEDTDSNYLTKIKAIQLEIEKNNIHAIPLARLIEISDEKWQTAIESLLGNDRFNLIVEKETHLKTMKIAKNLAFRSYISAFEEKENNEKVKKHSALEKINLRDKRIPEWIYNYLNNTCLIDSLDEISAFPEFENFITIDAYSVTKKGGISRKVSDTLCKTSSTRNRIENLKNELLEKGKIHTEIKSTFEKYSKEIQALQNSIKIVSEYENSSKNSENFDDLKVKKDDLNNFREKEQKITKRLIELSDDVEKAYQMHLEISQKVGQFRNEESHASKSYETYKTQYLNVFQKLDSFYTENKIFCFYGLHDEEISLLSETKVLAKIETLQKEIDEFEEKHQEDGKATITDVHIHNFNKRKTQLSNKKQTLTVSRENLQKITEETNTARERYISVLKTSMTFYKKNVEILSEIAGANVTISLPKIENTMESIQSAGLDIRFSFDGKSLHNIDSGESSGGQKVIESLILLIALLKDDDQHDAGFVFIDEPFAHLDVANVDKVGQFLESTGAQYIITTPNTQNIGVFRPSKLTIITQKKGVGKTFAPAPKYAKKEKTMTYSEEEKAS